MQINLEKVLAVSQDCLQSRTRLKSIMKDLYPENKRDINILLSAFESGAPSKIAKQGSISYSEYKTYVKRIVDEYGMQEQFAVEALDAWIDVFLGKGTATKVKGSGTPIGNSGKPQVAPTPKKQTTNTPGKSGNTPKPLPAKPGNAPASDESLYSYEEITGGYAIKKFMGFDETDISLPDNYNGKPVVRIANAAFKDCLTIKRVYLGKNIKVLETSAFRGCESLEMVYGCEQLEYIGDSVFADCRNLIDIPVSDSILFIGKQAFANTAITSFAIPSSIDFVSAHLFELCKKLVSVTLHDRIIALGEGCFMHCDKLNNVIVPAGVKYIGPYAFLNCTGMRSLTIESQDAVLQGTAVIKESYIWQPDRRYNPKTKYRNLSNITVYCRPGSTTQMYCRNQDISCAKLDWNGSIPKLGDMKDPIGIWVKMSWGDELKKKKFKAIKAVEVAEDIVVEHKGSESLLIFKDVNRISQQIIDSLLIESFEKGQQKRWDPFVIPYTKEDLLKFDSNRRMF